MRVRPITLPQDQSVIEELVERGTNGLAVLSEAQVLGLRSRASHGVIAEDGVRARGYAGLVPASQAGEWAMEVVVDDQAAVPELVGAALAIARSQGGESLRWWVYGPEAAELPIRYGLEPERLLLKMSRPLPHPEAIHFDPGIVVAGFRPGVDEEAWLALNNAAFDGHPENGSWTNRELDERIATGWFSAEGFRMAWSGADLIGFCWTKVHPGGDGEIYVIAVDPAWAGKGLGRKLVLEGMRHLSREGCQRVILYTEGDNERAVALYRRLGFEIDQTHRSFTIDLGDAT